MIRLTANCSMSWSLPLDVVASAASLIGSKRVLSHSPKARASRALGKMNEGARCMRSSMTVVFTPPAAFSSFMPRL